LIKLLSGFSSGKESGERLIFECQSPRYAKC
jgi:hypothetical protein